VICILADTNEVQPFPEMDNGPKLRRLLKTGSWEIARERLSYFNDNVYYTWQGISNELGNQLLKKIEAGEHIQVLLKDNDDIVLSPS
jgi:hypothetical protein